MRDQEWDPTAAELHALDLAELVLGLLGLDAVHGEAALGVVDEAEVLAGLLDRDDVHEARGVGDVGADLVVDLDVALHQDGLGLTAVERFHGQSSCPHIKILFSLTLRGHVLVEGISQAVADEDDEGKAVAGLVRTGADLGSVSAAKLVQHPRAGGGEPLLVLLAIVEVSLKMFDSRDGIFESGIAGGPRAPPWT